MSAILTTAGTAHLVELAQGDVPTNAFDGLVLGQGNVEPTVTDTLDQITRRLPIVLKLAKGFPKQGDTDSRNAGRGADVYTWRFERPAGEAFVASNAAVTNFSGGALIEGAPLLAHVEQTVAQRLDHRLIVWLNATQAGAPTLFTAEEQALENRIQRVVGFVAQTQALAAHPHGSVIDPNEVHVFAQPGQSVFTMARIMGQEGGLLQHAEVERFRLKISRLGPDGYVESPAGTQPDCARDISAAVVTYDQRWNAGGGYNVSHLWRPLAGTKEGTYRLEYTITLCNRDLRKWTTMVEIR